VGDSRPLALALRCRRGFADSKTLNEERRDRLFDVIQGETHMGAEADVLSAAFICGRQGAALGAGSLLVRHDAVR
jgi:ribonuclease HII